MAEAVVPIFLKFQLNIPQYLGMDERVAKALQDDARVGKVAEETIVVRSEQVAVLAHEHGQHCSKGLEYVFQGKGGCWEGDATCRQDLEKVVKGDGGLPQKEV